MLVSRCSSELSGHQDLTEIKKVTASDRSEAQWDLLFLFPRTHTNSEGLETDPDAKRQAQCGHSFLREAIGSRAAARRAGR
jgi:hypothetical protein